ncbi:MAG TPA: GNAT family N-acetyltransferase [Thermotogota bacterium]|mgnify:CR=1 FL=1|nr:GNAT family N-acetyltransferase [Thermotogota bacterium]HRW93920.1 GNAT family N-acetyltransferase [Thermotogota bacterium]
MLQTDPWTIRPLLREEWELYKDVRLRALKESPDAFRSVFSREKKRSDPDWKETYAREVSSGNAFFLVAMVGKRSVGLGLARVDPDKSRKGFLHSVWVDPEFRGRGMGRAMMHMALEWLKGRGVEQVQLSVTLRDSPAMRLYRSLGFHPVGEAEALRKDSGFLLQEMLLDWKKAGEGSEKGTT